MHCQRKGVSPEFDANLPQTVTHILGKVIFKHALGQHGAGLEVGIAEDKKAQKIKRNIRYIYIMHNIY